MATVTKKLLLDVSRKNLLPNIVAKQYDTDSRFLTVQLLDEGKELKAESGSTVIISFRRADGQAKSFAGTANEDGTVTVPIANWALELDDIVECDISVYRGEAKLSTTTFKLEVQPAANGSGDISEDEDYDILKQLIVEVKTATEGANSAAAEAEKWKNVSATAKGLEAGAAPTVSLSDTESGKTFSFGIPKGDKGDPGLINGVRLNGAKVEPDAESVVDINAYNEDNKPEIGGRNLIIRSTEDTGYYIDKEGRNSYAYPYSTSDYIGVKPKEKYVLQSWTNGHERAWISVAWYTEEKIYIGGYIDDTSLDYISRNVDSPSNAFFARFSYYAQNLVKAEHGEISTDWSPAPEDLEVDPSNTTPLPSATTGAVGNEPAFARGDHVHPFSDLEVVTRDSVYDDFDLYKIPGVYMISTTSEMKHSPAQGVNIFGTLFVIKSPNYFAQILTLNNSLGSFYRTGYNEEYEPNWIPIDSTASNFSGVLPIEKGGTGNGRGSIYHHLPSGAGGGAYVRQIINENSGAKAATGVFANSSGLSSAYLGVGDEPYQSANNIEIRTNADGSIVGQYKGREIATTPSVISTQLALASLYESREALKTSAVQSDTAMSSPTFDGELSALDRNMIQVYTDLCLNPDSGKVINDVPENLREQVQTIVEKTLAERKEAEEKYKEEMEKRNAELEAEARRKAELEAEPEPSAEKEGTEES